MAISALTAIFPLSTGSVHEVVHVDRGIVLLDEKICRKRKKETACPPAYWVHVQHGTRITIDSRKRIYQEPEH